MIKESINALPFFDVGMNIFLAGKKSCRKKYWEQQLSTSVEKKRPKKSPIWHVD